jgi:hypothetical protein
MTTTILLPLQGGNNKPIRSPRALPWAIGRLAFLAIILAICLSSCAPGVLKNITKQLPPLDDSAKVAVYGMGDTVPENSEILGGLFISRNKDWETVLDIAKNEARAAGGNGLEIQLQAEAGHYSKEKKRIGYAISAFILNVNDSIKPSQPIPYEKKEFQDYVVMKEGDTVPCFIAFESKSHLQFAHGYDRSGHRKALSLPKSDLISYHIEDPEAFKKAQQKRRLCNGKIAANVGYSLLYESYNCATFAANVRFVGNNNFSTFGIHYLYSTNFDNHSTIFNSHIIAGSIGFMPIKIKTKSRNQTLDSYLDGGIEPPEFNKKHRFFYDLLLGFYYDSERWWDYQSSVGIGLGLNISFDFMLTEHLGIGVELYEFFLMEKLRYSLEAGLRYYF